jgi:hypothetical protein
MRTLFATGPIPGVEEAAIALVKDMGPEQLDRIRASGILRTEQMLALTVLVQKVMERMVEDERKRREARPS